MALPDTPVETFPLLVRKRKTAGGSCHALVCFVWLYSPCPCLPPRKRPGRRTTPCPLRTGSPRAPAVQNKSKTAIDETRQYDRNEQNIWHNVNKRLRQQHVTSGRPTAKAHHSRAKRSLTRVANRFSARKILSGQRPQIQPIHRWKYDIMTYLGRRASSPISAPVHVAQEHLS